MIESCYWKADLLEHAKRLKPVTSPKRWTEKSQVNLEKEVIVSFFKIRKLIEQHRVSNKTKLHRSTILAYPSLGIRVTLRNRCSIDELYDLESESIVSKSILFIANQFIHSGAIFAYREKDRNWGGFTLCSDFEQQKWVYKVSVGTVIAIFNLVARDYPNELRYVFNPLKGDYDVQTD